MYIQQRPTKLIFGLLKENFNGKRFLQRLNINVISDFKVDLKWPEEKQEKIPERQSRRPSPDLPEPDSSFPLGGNSNSNINPIYG